MDFLIDHRLRDRQRSMWTGDKQVDPELFAGMTNEADLQFLIKRPTDNFCIYGLNETVSVEISRT